MKSSMTESNYRPNQNLNMWPWSTWLVVFGLTWIGTWAVLGSLMGTQIHGDWTSADAHAWLNSWQRMLIRSAHAHMNSMGILSVALGAWGASGTAHDDLAKLFFRATLIFIISTCVLGLGLVLQAYQEPVLPHELRAGVFLSGLGALGFICSCLFFSYLCIRNTYRQSLNQHK